MQKIVRTEVSALPSSVYILLSLCTSAQILSLVSPLASVLKNNYDGSVSDGAIRNL
ncbi:MAG: hypothetical protein ACP5UA_14170 [Candidatus Hydrogenedens sp.]